MKILLFKGRGIVSRLIKWQTGGQFSHSAVQLVDGSIIEAWQGGGVRRKFLRDYSDIVAFEVSGVSLEQQRVVGEWLLTQLGKGYDWWGVLRFISRSRLPRNDAWFCSELVFEAYLQAGVELLARTESWEVSPTMLSRSTLLVSCPLFERTV